MEKRSEDLSELAEWAWAEAIKRSAGGESERNYVSPFGAYKDDPIRFGREVLGDRYWPGQEAIMRALITHKRVTVRSCRKAGKTFTAADLTLAFVSTAPTIVVTTAPTVRQVRELIWQRIGAAHARSLTPLPGKPGVQQLRIAKDWYAIGVATSDPENVLGFHAGVEVPEDPTEPLKQEERVQSVFDSISSARSRRSASRLLIIFDEASGIHQGIFDALAGSISGENVYALMVANPRMSWDSGHTYANSFMPGSGWYRIHLAAEEPRDDPVPSDECYHSVPEWLLPKSWVDERRREWGEDGPLFQSDVLGCFSTATLDRQIVPLHVLESASKWELVDDDQCGSRHIGCDIAGGETAGKDWCIATLFVNGALSCVHRWKSPDTMHSLHMIEALADRWGPVSGQRIPWTNIHIDATGVGKGIVDRLRQRGLFVDGVNFGAGPRYDWKHITGDLKFRDRKSELYWIMRRALQEGMCVVPRKYGEVWRQLQWHTYGHVRRSNDTALAIVEGKDWLRERYGKSPDEADAAVLAWSRSNRRPTFRIAGAGSFVRP